MQSRSHGGQRTRNCTEVGCDAMGDDDENASGHRQRNEAGAIATTTTWTWVAQNLQVSYVNIAWDRNMEASSHILPSPPSPACFPCWPSSSFGWTWTSGHLPCRVKWSSSSQFAAQQEKLSELGGWEMNISKNTGLLVTVIDGEEEVELMLCAFTRWPGLSCLHDFRLGAVEVRGIFVDGLRLSVSPLAARTRNEFCIQLDNGPFVWQTVLDGSLLENEHDHTLRLTQREREIMEFM